MVDHATTPQLFYDGDWQPAAVYERDRIAISRGAPGEGQDSPPSTAALTLDNRDGNASPLNPTGALYGKAGRNTPMRVLADDSVRSTTEAASWKPGRAIKGDRWTAVGGGGILQRLQQGKTPLKAPLDRAILFQDPVAFWPLNDGDTAQQFASGLPGGLPIVAESPMRPGLVPGPAGTTGSFLNLVSEEYETVSGDNVGSFAGSATVTVPALDPAGWAVEGIFLIERISPGQLVTASSAVQWDVTGGVGAGGWSISLSGSSDGTCDITVAGANPGFFSEAGVVLPPGWHYFRFVAEQVGADVEVSLYVDGVLEETDTVTSVTLGVPTNLRLGAHVDDEFAVQNARTAVIGMLAFTNLATSVDNTEAAGGWDGELAGVRFLRLGPEEGVTTVVVGDEADTQAMGPQPPDTFVNLLKECVRTDAALMFEPREQIGVAMRTGRSMYNQASALDLSMTAEQIAPLLVPVIDDKPTRNDVTVERRNGSTARAVQETGPLNVQDPTVDPQGVGRVDTKIDVNTATDSVLNDHAHWHLAKGTVDEPRFPQITVDLDSAPALIPTVNAVEIGDRITAADFEVDEAPDGANQIVLGIRESLPAKRRLVTFVCAPASPFEVAIVGANDGSTDLRGARVGTRLSTLNGAINSTTTTVVIDSAGVPWTTSANAWNPARNGGGLFVAVGGETMRVTNITGAGSAWTLTVERSVNGVVKQHADGAPIGLRYPARVGL